MKPGRRVTKDGKKGTIKGTSPNGFGHYMVLWDGSNTETREYSSDLTPIKEEPTTNCDYAQLVCRELRYQLVKHGNIGDMDAIMYHLMRWLDSEDAIKYDRPELPKKQQQ